MGKIVENQPNSSINHSGTGTNLLFSTFPFLPSGILAFLHSIVTSSPALLLEEKGVGLSF